MIAHDTIDVTAHDAVELVPACDAIAAVVAAHDEVELVNDTVEIVVVAHDEIEAVPTFLLLQ